MPEGHYLPVMQQKQKQKPYIVHTGGQGAINRVGGWVVGGWVGGWVSWGREVSDNSVSRHACARVGKGWSIVFDIIIT